MNIIQELRDLADLYGGCLYEDRVLSNDLHSIADRLTASGALVPVKDGEPCEMDYTERYHFIVWNEHVCVPDKLRWMLVRITDNYRYDVASLCAQSHKFQPVRLVPITEAQI